MELINEDNYFPQILVLNDCAVMSRCLPVLMMHLHLNMCVLPHLADFKCHAPCGRLVALGKSRVLRRYLKHSITLDYIPDCERSNAHVMM